jgi:hypothetical protein
MRVMQVCGDIMGLRSWESIWGPLAKHHAQLMISFGGTCFLIYGGLCPIFFSKELGLMVPYLCSRFCIFDIHVLEEYVLQVEGGLHLL